MKEKLYCEECGRKIENYNEYGDEICKECEDKFKCSHCGIYCYQEMVDGMCEDCYEDYLDDLEEDED